MVKFSFSCLVSFLLDLFVFLFFAPMFVLMTAVKNVHLVGACIPQAHKLLGCSIRVGEEHGEAEGCGCCLQDARGAHI